MNLIHETSFAVFPQDCNYHPPMIFGGKMLAEMDRCAATTVRRFLYDSPKGAKHALTVAVNNLTFHKGAEVGDLIFIKGTIIKVGTKSLVVKVVAEREKLIQTARNKIVNSPSSCLGFGGYSIQYESIVSKEKMAEGEFTFCAYDMEYKISMEHGMKL